MKTIKVLRANTTDGGRVYFDAEINGITLYGMNIATNKDGEEFVGFPAQKSVNGKYYKHYYIPFTDDETELILTLVKAKI